MNLFVAWKEQLQVSLLRLSLHSLLDDDDDACDEGKKKVLVSFDEVEQSGKVPKKKEVEEHSLAESSMSKEVVHYKLKKGHQRHDHQLRFWHHLKGHLG